MTNLGRHQHAYSGNNGRAAILNDQHGANVFYTTGNAGNGGDPQPNGIIIGAGAQIMTAAHAPLAQQPDPGLPMPVGSFNVTQLGLKADKVGKDTNFRGLTVFNNVIYVTKGSGSNGVTTVYFIDTSGFDATGKPLAYTLQAGLGLGVPYTVQGYPTGNNATTKLPWSPATDGLRNITGRVNRDGTATIWAITSTVSGNGDQGADPNKLVVITDNLAATTLPAGESFTTARTARFGETLRGVSFTPAAALAGTRSPTSAAHAAATGAGTIATTRIDRSRDVVKRETLLASPRLRGEVNDRSMWLRLQNGVNDAPERAAALQ